MNILTLDGGGSKGIYSLGILNELELMLDKPLFEHFQFIYGTSTGAIIAALIGSGYNIPEVKKLYLEMIPKIMQYKSARGRSNALKHYLNLTFGDNNFNHFKTGIGIIATNLDNEKPFIFKTSVDQSYKLKHSFEPGFGCTIKDAIVASCAAYPIFQKTLVKTKNQGDILAIDGGFIANNPILFAVADVINALQVDLSSAKFLSIGTGNFVEKAMGIKSKFFKSLQFVKLFESILKANANTIDIQVNLLFKEISLVRINDSFNQPDYGTNMIESDLRKLNLLFGLGRQSFEKYEDDVRSLFKTANHS